MELVHRVAKLENELAEVRESLGLPNAPHGSETATSTELSYFPKNRPVVAPIGENARGTSPYSSAPYPAEMNALQKLIRNV